MSQVSLSGSNFSVEIKICGLFKRLSWTIFQKNIGSASNFGSKVVHNHTACDSTNCWNTLVFCCFVEKTLKTNRKIFFSRKTDYYTNFCVQLAKCFHRYFELKTTSISTNQYEYTWYLFKQLIDTVCYAFVGSEFYNLYFFNFIDLWNTLWYKIQDWFWYLYTTANYICLHCQFT